MRPTIVDAIRTVDAILSGSRGAGKKREIPGSHFFCPRNPRNRELVDSELPDADTVRRACTFFESKSREELRDTASDNVRRVQRAPLDYYQHSEYSDYEEEEEDEDEEESENFEDAADFKLIPDAVLDRIRAHGSSVTYFGGKVVARSAAPLSPTRKVLREILQSSSPLEPFQQRWSQGWSVAHALKSRLVKSNSCDSRLEILVLEPAPPDAPQPLL